MARFAVYKSPTIDPNMAQGVDNLAGGLAAAFSTPDTSALEKSLQDRLVAQAQADKYSGEAEALARKQRLLDARAAAVRNRDLGELFATTAGLGEGELDANVAKLNLGAYAAGVGATPPAADPIHDPMLSRLAIGAGESADNTGLGLVFKEGQAGERNAATQAAATERTRLTAGANERARKYAADKALEGTKYRVENTASSTSKPGSLKDVYALSTDPNTEALISEAVVSVLGGGDVDPELLTAATTLAKQNVIDAMSSGKVLSFEDAARLAVADIESASGAGAETIGTGWFFDGPERIGVPGMKVPPRKPAVVAPAPVVTTKSSQKQVTTGPGRASPAAPAPAAPALDDNLARAKAAIAGGKDRAAVIQRLRQNGYTDAQITAAGL